MQLYQVNCIFPCKCIICVVSVISFHAGVSFVFYHLHHFMVTCHLWHVSGIIMCKCIISVVSIVSFHANTCIICVMSVSSHHVDSWPSEAVWPWTETSQLGAEVDVRPLLQCLNGRPAVHEWRKGAHRHRCAADNWPVTWWYGMELLLIAASYWFYRIKQWHNILLYIPLDNFMKYYIIFITVLVNCLVWCLNL